MGELILKRLAEDPDNGAKKANNIDKIRELIKSAQSMLEQRVKPTAGRLLINRATHKATPKCIQIT